MEMMTIILNKIARPEKKNIASLSHVEYKFKTVFVSMSYMIYDIYDISYMSHILSTKKVVRVLYVKGKGTLKREGVRESNQEKKKTDTMLVYHIMKLT